MSAGKLPDTSHDHTCQLAGLDPANVHDKVVEPSSQLATGALAIYETVMKPLIGVPVTPYWLTGVRR